MEPIMKDFLNGHSRQSNSLVATVFGVVVTVLLVGGYEAIHSATDSGMVAAPATTADAVVRMETIVVTATRG
jgi:hypothetical protein